MGRGLRIKEIAYYRGSLKNLIFSVESQKSNIYGGLSKNGVLGEFADLRGHLVFFNFWALFLKM